VRVGVGFCSVIKLSGWALQLEQLMNLEYFQTAEISTCRNMLQRVRYYLHNFYKKVKVVFSTII